MSESSPVRKIDFDDSVVDGVIIDPETFQLLDLKALETSGKTKLQGGNNTVYKSFLRAKETLSVAVKEIRIASAMADEEISDGPVVSARAIADREIQALIAANDIDCIASLVCWSFDERQSLLYIATHFYEGGNLNPPMAGKF